MKKRFLLSMAFVLLAILAVEFVIDRYRSESRKNKLQAAVIVPVVDAAASASVRGDDIYYDDFSKNVATSKVEASKNAAVCEAVVKHKSRHTRHTVREDLQVASNNPGEIMTTWDDENPLSGMGIIRSKEYAGYIPIEHKEQVIVNTDAETNSVHKNNARFAPEIGFMQNSFYNNDHTLGMQSGFHAGFIVDVPLSIHLALQPGLRYALKGAEEETITTDAHKRVDTKDRISLHYVEVPVDLVVKFGDPHHWRFMLGAGPYISYLVKAQDKYETTTTTFGNGSAKTTNAIPPGSAAINTSSISGQNHISVGNDNPNGANSIRGYDWGVNGFVGVEAPAGFYAKAGSEAGLRDLQQNKDGSYSGRNVNLFVSLGYLIGSKK